MKKTLHRLLSLLLVLALVICAVPAVFADDPPENPDPIDPPTHSDSHVLIYTSIEGDSLHHKVTCSVEGCDFAGYEEACQFSGEAKFFANGWHLLPCAHSCGNYMPQECRYTGAFARVANTLTHVQHCDICGHEGEPEDCVDADANGKCDVCGGEMKPAEEQKVLLAPQPFDDLIVPQGKKFEELGLPATATCVVKGSLEKVYPYITWKASDFDMKKLGVQQTIHGTATINSQYGDAYVFENNQKSIDVEVKVTISAYNISISTDATGSLMVGNTRSFTANYTQSAERDLYVKWSVDCDEKIATINQNGVLAAVSTGSSTSGRTVTVTATLMKTNVTTPLAKDSKSVEIVPIRAAAFSVSVPGSGVLFDEDDFYMALGGYYYSGALLDYVKFDSTYSYGTLYVYNGYWQNSKLPSGAKCYYDYNSTTDKDGYDLDTVSFVPANNVTGVKSLGYTAYNASGNVIGVGEIELVLSTAKISYTIDGNDRLSFDEDDFRAALRKVYPNASLSYVYFDMDNAVFGSEYKGYGGSSKYGYLYCDSTLKTKLNSSTDNSPFYYNNGGSHYYDYDLDDVTYVPGTASGKYTVTVPFTAHGSSYSMSSSQNVTVVGNVEITVNGTDSFAIECTGTNFTSLNSAIADAYPTATSVTFKQPENGTLYYEYQGINNYRHRVRASDTFALKATRSDYDIDDVYLVPAAGATRVTVSFEVYRGSTRLGSNSATFTVRTRNASRVFNDVTYNNTGSWSADSVDFMYANGLIKGVGRNSFNPNGSMTRGDLVLILYRLAGSPSVANVQNPFRDVKSSDYYYKAVLWAYSKNVVKGTGNTTFSPKSSVTREQLASILYRYSGSPTSSIRLSGFVDTGRISNYALDAMKWAVGQGIINGTGSKLEPQGHATRAQVAAMLHRYLTK